MIPRSSAASRLGRPRPTPTTVSTAPARLLASANEPPIRPTPATTTFPNAPALIMRSAPEGRSQCVEKALILRRQADGDAKVLGQSVVGDRAHDDAATQKLLVDGGRIADVHQKKIPMRRDIAHVHLGKAPHQLVEARPIEASAFLDVFGVTERA